MDPDATSATESIQAKAAEQAEERRSRSKISRLPSVTREELNRLLGEGLAYADVLAQVGEPAKHITELDISRWFSSGHKLWLQQKAWLGHITNSFEAAKDMV